MTKVFNFYTINPVISMKKILFLIIIPILLNTAVYAAYTVDIPDNSGYIVDEIPVKNSRYFKHTCTWEKIEQEEIIINKKKLTVHLDSSEHEFKLEAEVMPLNASDRRITYSSTNEAVASVDERGNITTYNVPGEATISAVSGKVSARCKVLVVKGVTGVTVSQSQLQLYADRPAAVALTASIEPPDASIDEVEWLTDDASIATVDQNGTVIPCGVGTTFVTAKTVDGGYTASCQITVDTFEKKKALPTLFYTDYSIKLEDAADIQLTANPTVFTSNTSPASYDDVKYYLNPQNFTDDYGLYQFLDLSGSNGMDADKINSYLAAKGVLENMGDVFINAAKKNNISEIYLAVHACLESGNGSSQLATGVEVNGVTVYNMFGIGAVDSDPVRGGAEYAYTQGWTTVEAAIEGGAEWISKNYVNSGQNTLYKMRWNPDRPGTHQYATDVAWASKQAKTLKNMFSAFPGAKLTFEFPIYKNQPEPTIRFD